MKAFGMKASELRIGNFVKDSDAQEVPMLAEDVMHFAYGNAEFEPIPLTEEWLNRFGFEIAPAGDRWAGHLLKESWQGWRMRVVDNKWIQSDYGPDAELKYVHQLQNLYFALTGKELELKS